MSDDLDVYTTTRRSLQSVAEHVLAAALHVAIGRIGLRATPGGFGTPWFDAGEGRRRLRVEGLDLVVEQDGQPERRAPLTTVRAAAELAGVLPGAPVDVYRPSTALDPDRPLELDGPSAARLAAWYELTGTALERLRAERQGDAPSEAQLWPEHFDLATTIAEVNYGGSPGDEGHPSPYLLSLIHI